MQSYSAKLVLVTIDGVAVTGLAEDSFVKITFDEDFTTKRVSREGIPSRALRKNYCAGVEMVFHQTSPGQQLLEALYAKDRYTSDGIGEIVVQDLLGGNKHHMAEAWVKKAPDSDFGVEIKDWTWQLDAGEDDPEFKGN